MTHALDGCVAKLDRAETHLDTIQTECRKLVEDGPHLMRTEFNKLDDSYSAFLEEIPEIPLEVGIMVGEFFHNLRSSLDHLICRLIENVGRPVLTSHQFPIVDNKDDWNDKVAKPFAKGKGLLAFLVPTQVAIIESLQPYNPTTGYKSLAMIRDFSNLDKHRLISSAVYSQTHPAIISGTAMLPAQIKTVRLSGPDTLLEVGTEIARVNLAWTVPVSRSLRKASLPENTEVEMDLKFHMTTLFGEPKKEWARVSDLRQALTDVSFISAGFSSAFI